MSFQLLYELSCCPVGSCWWIPSLSKRRALARGSITDVRLGWASGSTEVKAARSWRISQRYHKNQDRNGLNQQQQKVAATATYNQIQFLHPWKKTLHILNQVMRAILVSFGIQMTIYTTIADWNCIACFMPWCMKQLITTVVPLQTRKPSSRNTPTPVARHPLPMENPPDDSGDYTGDSGYQEPAQWTQHMHHPTLLEGT